MSDATAWVEAFRELLGEEHVVLQGPALREAETATFQTDQRVPCVLRPASAEEVEACVRLAQRFGVPVYPTSSGKNWGYGSGVPVQDGTAVLDLSRLNRVLELDEELAYVTVEPGVTQRQLHALLLERGSRLWMDATGSSPDCSLIGNAMERGFGHTPYGDHFGQVCGLEVVLPTGGRIHTGFGRFPGARGGPVHRWGLGPSLDGLFSQSNLGIVTKATFWLMPAPERFEAYYLSVERDEQLPALVDALRPLRLDGTLRSVVHIANGYKVYAMSRPYPWKDARDRTPLPPELRSSFAREAKIGAWNGSGGLYGTRAQVAEGRRRLKQALRPLGARVRFLDDRKLALAERFSGAFSLLSGLNLSELLGPLRASFELLKGRPSDFSLSSAYWRKREPHQRGENPGLDRCGLIWCSPVAPLRGADALAITRIADRVLLDGGFEPQVSLSLITERSLSAVICLTYDRDVAGEDARAMRCYRDLMDALTASGYYPYRLGIQSMQALARWSEPESSSLLRRIKDAVDPRGILAPGRYLAGAERASSDADLRPAG